MWFSKIIYLFTLLLSLVFTESAAAEEINLKSRAPTKDEIIEALKPGMESGEKGLTRGISIRPKDKTANTGSKAISLEIQFAFNSAQLTDEAVKQLTPVAEALVSGDLENLKFLVEGYTDAKGTDEYNKDLSLRRAATVRDFFVAEHGLAASRIQFSGHGEQGLLDPANPYSAANRRVRIAAMP
ncbi:OmpA family protein [Methylomonas sp. MO1]|uniref:OmpA family protein n=1 Tax=Methylomonas sp. MO1 TaxID=3073619 RepID=UPI0028A2F9E5|nr:OmpA family protein [Methylomonas sp. MO1]MDT4291940.1 OmpA family protein [Methylomonas sp. MO1]